MLRFLKRPEVVYCLAVAVISAALHLEMLDGTLTRNTDWNDPDWSPSGEGSDR